MLTAAVVIGTLKVKENSTKVYVSVAGKIKPKTRILLVTENLMQICCQNSTKYRPWPKTNSVKY